MPILCHSVTLLFSAHAMLISALPMPCSSYLCRCYALFCGTMTTLDASLLCLRASLPKLCIALPMPCASVQCQYPAMLCLSFTYLRIATALHRYSMPLRYPPMLCLALPMLVQSMPLLRYSRLDLSVQCLSDTILVIATAPLFLSLPLLCLTLPSPFVAVHRRSSPLRR